MAQNTSRNEAIQKLLSSIDIVDIISRYISVNKRGRNYLALCPFHDDTNPSLTISPEKQIYKCFVCGAGGNAISFVADYQKISYYDAALRIAKLVNFNDLALTSNVVKKVDDKLEPLYKTLEDLKNFYIFNLETEEGQDAVKYLEGRNLNREIRKKFNIGYAPLDGHKTIEFLLKKGHSIKTLTEIGIVGGTLDNPFDINRGRVMFPLSNADGRVVGFSGRIFREGDESAKYMNSPESPIFHKTSLLYNYHNAKNSVRNEKAVYVLEGFMDVIALSRSGINAAVAVMGTAFTSEHAALLRMLKVEVRLCLDGDRAGQMATLQAMKVLDNAHLKYVIVNNNDDLRDPDEIFQAEGSDGLKKYLNNTVDKMEFTFNYYQKANPLTTLEEKKVFVRTMLPIIANLTDELDIAAYLHRLGEVSGYSYQFLVNEFKKIRAKKAEDKRAYVVPDTKVLKRRRALSRLQLSERAIIHQMILFPEAVTYTKENKIFLSDEFYRFLYNYLMNNETHDSTKTYSALVNHINLNTSDENKRKERLDKLDELIALDSDTKFSPGIIDDAYRTIKSEREIDHINKEYDEKLATTNDPVERAKLYQEKLDKLKKVKQKKRG